MDENQKRTPEYILDDDWYLTDPRLNLGNLLRDPEKRDEWILKMEERLESSPRYDHLIPMLVSLIIASKWNEDKI